jgi:hypothetical protein
MNVRWHRRQSLVFLTLLALIFNGCDTGRVGMHKVMFTQPATVGSTDDERLKQLVRTALAGKGFQEKPGIPHIWRKRGTTVEVYHDHNGVLILRVGAFGSKRDVRVSERTEQELLAVLKEQSGLEMTPTTPPKATIE